MTNQNILKNDLPITKFDDDNLDRQKFAIQMRKIIKNYNKKRLFNAWDYGFLGIRKNFIY